MKADMTIYRPNEQAPLQRTLFGAATLLAWVAYAYLVLPLVTLVLWMLGLHTAYLQLYLVDHPFDPTLLLILPLLALICATILIVWAEYNRRRFRGEERRGRAADVSDLEIALALGSNAAFAQCLRNARHVTLVMGDDARPTAMHLHEQGAFAPTVSRSVQEIQSRHKPIQAPALVD